MFAFLYTMFPFDTLYILVLYIMLSCSKNNLSIYYLSSVYVVSKICNLNKKGLLNNLSTRIDRIDLCRELHQVVFSIQQRIALINGTVCENSSLSLSLSLSGDCYVNFWQDVDNFYVFVFYFSRCNEEEKKYFVDLCFSHKNVTKRLDSVLIRV
jgi:hypothetical protein